MDNEQFEILAGEFYTEFHLMCPGKSQSPAIDRVDEAQTRRKLFDCWLKNKQLRTELADLKAEKNASHITIAKMAKREYRHILNIKEMELKNNELCAEKAEADRLLGIVEKNNGECRIEGTCIFCHREFESYK